MIPITETTTHDLWVEARQLDLDVRRPSDTTIELTITRPASLAVVDGAVVLLGSRPLEPNGYPVDGTQYTANLAYGGVGAQVISGMQVVAFYSAIMQAPFPAGTPSADGATVSWTIMVTGTDPDTVYYASIHGASQVLQYYPLGVQAYPLEASAIEKDSASYAGSIPSLPTAPTSPTPGMVYFDQQLRVVQYWDAARGVWVPTRSDSIISGEYNPGVLGHVYLLSPAQLRAFDGAVWVVVTGANLQLAAGAGWVPLGAVSAGTSLPTSPAAGDLAYDYTTRRVQYWDGTSWQVPSPATTLLSTGGGPVPAFTVPFSIEPVELLTPYVGLLFYNTATRTLNAWSGTAWVQANTAQHGTPTTDKVGIGSDGTYDLRLRMINVLKAQLGWPAQCVELSEEQFNVAIDNALDTYRQLCIGAYEQRFIMYMLLRDQAVYHLNSPVDRTDAIVTVQKIHRLNVLGVNGAGPENTWSQLWAQEFYNFAGQGANLLSSHLTHAWSEEFTRIFAGDIPFTWNEARRELFLKRAIRQNEKVVLEVELERSEQELMVDRWCKQFIQNWALAECKEYLGLIRSKFSSGTPGPAGTISLNGETLLAEARQDFTELKQALLDYEHQNAEHGNVAFLLA